MARLGRTGRVGSTPVGLGNRLENSSKRQIGLNLYNRSPVFLDPYDDYKYTNGNCWIVSVK